MTVSDVTTDIGLRWHDGNTDLPDPNAEFFLDIDAALKTKLQGIFVADTESTTDRGRREARVYFRWPQVEVTDQTFPFITIDLLRIVRAAEREQRSGDPFIPYVPSGYEMPVDGIQFLHTEDMPIPYDFVYQVTTHARYVTHSRAMWLELIQDHRLPTRGGYLTVGETIRQMMCSDGSDASGLDPQQGGRPKRHFRTAWTVSVHGELFQKDIEVLSKITTVITTIGETVSH